MPAEYIGLMKLDRARMEDVELWDGLARSPIMGLFEGQVRQMLGIGFDDIDSIEVYPGHKRAEDSSYRGTLMVLRGKGLELAPVAAGSLAEEGLEAVERGGIDTLRIGAEWNDDPMVWMAPEPGVLVMGSSYIVDPVLDGERHGVGVPHAGLMPLAAARGVLGQIAFFFPNGATRDEGFFLPIPDLDESDPVKGLVVRILEQGDGESFAMEALLEFEKGDVNAPKVLEMVQQGLATLAGHKQFGAMKKIWNAIAVERDGNRITARLDLGNSREAMGPLSQLVSLVPMMFMAESVSEPVPMAAPVQVEPAPAQGGKAPGGGGKGGG